LANFVALLQDYGALIYLLLFAYCALKSGVLPLFAGYAAQIGGVDLLSVIAVSFAGGYLGDEIRFFVARQYGEQFLSRWPKARRGLARAKQLMEHYGKVYIFLYRYPKGMRTIGALPVGLGKMRWLHFTICNAASAALWACLMIGTGYLFGAAIEQAVVENWGVVSVALLAAFIVLGIVAWRRIRHLSNI
jgi:membrane protein DedA with SNARE-associated domain